MNASMGGAGGAADSPCPGKPRCTLCPPTCPDTHTPTPWLKIQLCCRPASNPGARRSRLGASPQQRRCHPPVRPGTKHFRPTCLLWEEHPGTTLGRAADHLLPETPLHLMRRAPTRATTLSTQLLSPPASSAGEEIINQATKNKASAVFNSGGDGERGSHRARRGTAGQAEPGGTRCLLRPAPHGRLPLRGGPGASACSSEGPRGDPAATAAGRKRASGCLHPCGERPGPARGSCGKEPLRGGHLPLARTRSRSGALRDGGRRGTGLSLRRDEEEGG